MSLSKDILVTYYNKTSHTDFDVLVFTNNYLKRIPEQYIAWQVLRGQTSVDFTYPVMIQVGASYIKHGQRIKCGPLDAKIGSTWEIIQEKEDSTAVLRKVTGIANNSNGSVVIMNTIPDAWNGRRIDAGIFRDSRLMVTCNNIHVGDQANFMIKPELIFAVARQIEIGENFNTQEVMSYLKMFDLCNYPNGMNVFLTEQPGGGKYTFTAEKKY